MTGYANEQEYEEIISELSNFEKTISEYCNDLNSAGQDCVDNTENDPAAQRSAQKLGETVSKINEELSTINEVIRRLQEQLENIKEASNIANED